MKNIKNYIFIALGVIISSYASPAAPQASMIKANLNTLFQNDMFQILEVAGDAQINAIAVEITGAVGNPMNFIHLWRFARGLTVAAMIVSPERRHAVREKLIDSVRFANAAALNPHFTNLVNAIDQTNGNEEAFNEEAFIALGAAGYNEIAAVMRNAFYNAFQVPNHFAIFEAFISAAQR